eukprot:745999-Hanusia_phi.AAC.7
MNPPLPHVNDQRRTGMQALLRLLDLCNAILLGSANVGADKISSAQMSSPRISKLLLLTSQLPGTERGRTRHPFSGASWAPGEQQTSDVVLPPGSQTITCLTLPVPGLP